MLRMGLGYVDGISHDYVCQCTIIPFAAPDFASGTVPAQRKLNDRPAELLALLRHIEANVAVLLDVHPICETTAPATMIE